MSIGRNPVSTELSSFLLVSKWLIFYLRNSEIVVKVSYKTFSAFSGHTMSSYRQQLFAPEFLTPFPHLCTIGPFWRQDFRVHEPLHFFHKITLRNVPPVSCRKLFLGSDKKIMVMESHCQCWDFIFHWTLLGFRNYYLTNSHLLSFPALQHFLSA